MFLVGIDGGGTHTECAIAQNDRVLARHTAGTSKIHKVDKEKAGHSLRAAVEGALRAAKIKPQQIAATCIGIAGASHPEVVDWCQKTLASLVAGKISVVGDNEIAHAAAFRGGAGVLVIAGTGSIAYGRDSNGVSARAGGWGPVISDEGSGTWIGRGAIARILRTYDDGRRTAMTQKIFAAWNVRNHEELVREANRNPAPDFSELFPMVLEAAREGDPVAEDLLAKAGLELASLAAAVAGKLWPDADPLTVCGTGGILEHSAIVRASLDQTLRGLRPNSRYDERKVDPIEGAVYLARASSH